MQYAVFLLAPLCTGGHGFGNFYQYICKGNILYIKLDSWYLKFPNIRNTHFDQKNVNSYNTNCCDAFEKIIQRFRSKRLHHYMYWYGVRVTIDSFYNTGTIVHVHLYPI